jgi:Spy/CpxP family protein refolding chaperone
MTVIHAFAAILALAGTINAAAQDSHNPQAHGGMAAPYSDMQRRAVKALSDQKIADLRAGRGMGMALAAELNGYPGPLHVLEHAGALQLTDEQRTRAAALIEAMKAETMPIGEEIIAAETELDRLFAAKQITPAALETAVTRIASAEGRLRAAHLRYHLTMKDLLSAEQVARYAELRGYRAAHQPHGGALMQ